MTKEQLDSLGKDSKVSSEVRPEIKNWILLVFKKFWLPIWEHFVTLFYSFFYPVRIVKEIFEDNPKRSPLFASGFLGINLIILSLLTSLLYFSPETVSSRWAVVLQQIWPVVVLVVHLGFIFTAVLIIWPLLKKLREKNVTLRKWLLVSCYMMGGPIIILLVVGAVLQLEIAEKFLDERGGRIFTEATSIMIILYFICWITYIFAYYRGLLSQPRFKGFATVFLGIVAANLVWGLGIMVPITYKESPMTFIQRQFIYTPRYDRALLIKGEMDNISREIEVPFNKRIKQEIINTRSQLPSPSYVGILNKVETIHFRVEDFCTGERSRSFIEKNTVVILPLFCRLREGVSVGYMLIHPWIDNKWEAKPSFIYERIRHLNREYFSTLNDYQKTIDVLTEKYEVKLEYKENSNQINYVSYNGDIYLCLYP